MLKGFGIQNDDIQISTNSFSVGGANMSGFLSIRLGTGNQTTLADEALPDPLPPFSAFPNHLGVVQDMFPTMIRFDIDTLTPSGQPVTPEPSTILLWTLMALGGGAYAYWRRRRLASGR